MDGIYGEVFYLRGGEKMANNFPRKEFECPCCGKVRASGWLIHQLNKVRDSHGKPMIINSGYRCEKHNKKIGGSSNSAHTRGLAVDIKCDNSLDRFSLTKLFFSVGFKRICVYSGWIHVDVDESLTQEVMWTP